MPYDSERRRFAATAVEVSSMLVSRFQRSKYSSMNAHAAAPIILNAMLRRCMLRSEKFNGDVAGGDVP
jgi:hypothetical protein